MRDSTRESVTVGLMADPGMAEEVAKQIAEDLVTRLQDRTGDTWQVETLAQELPLGPDGNVNLAEYAPGILEEHGWDYVFYLTELPAFYEQRPLLCRTVAQSRGALIVLPSLGAFRLPAQVLALVVTLLSTLSGTTTEIDLQSVGKDIRHKNMVQLLPGDSSVVVLRGRGANFGCSRACCGEISPLACPPLCLVFSRQVRPLVHSGCSIAAFGV